MQSKYSTFNSAPVSEELGAAYGFNSTGIWIKQCLRGRIITLLPKSAGQIAIITLGPPKTYFDQVHSPELEWMKKSD